MKKTNLLLSLAAGLLLVGLLVLLSSAAARAATREFPQHENFTAGVFNQNFQHETFVAGFQPAEQEAGFFGHFQRAASFGFDHSESEARFSGASFEGFVSSQQNFPTDFAAGTDNFNRFFG
jgi:ABC-type sugar transport system substrate-binding protein